ncbi:phosphotransferase [Mycobacterium sp. WUMAC-067]|nr:phosphotransferase [Mycobacterium sp. WUMAC-067]MCA2316985.1 phosphotransferase [Mycobacterium sp. WUMAC-025]
MLEALQGRGLKVPEFFGFNEKYGVILMERMDGDNQLASAPDDHTRKQVMAEYIEQLAKLHEIDVDSMQLSGLAIPQTNEQVAFAGKFAYVEQDWGRLRHKLRPEPFLELGIWWLHANVPSGERRVSFVQADTGPGQFMFADGHLTALIDWELSHIGDPMLDLGVIRMRNMLYPTGSLAGPLAHYEQVSGHPIDRQALYFYTVMSMLLTPLGVAPLMQFPTARVEHTLPSFGWDATLRRGLGDALAEAIGTEIEAPDLPEPAARQSYSLTDYLIEHLELNCEPTAADDARRHEIASAAAIARAVKIDSEVGAELRDADLDDMGVVLGRRPDSRDEGMARLNEIVAAGPSQRLEELVWLFARVARRREYLMQPLRIESASGEFERFTRKEVLR